MDSATSKQQGSMSGKSVASFKSKLSIVHRSDVLNSTLLAQLAAGKDYNRTTQITEWYKKYISASFAQLDAHASAPDTHRAAWLCRRILRRQYDTPQLVANNWTTGEAAPEILRLLTPFIVL